MPTPASRPVHPCVVSLTSRLRGAEFAVWAQLDDTECDDDDDDDNNDSASTANIMSHLVTASSNSITIYRVDPVSFTLQVEHSWRQLAGTVVSLSVLKSSSSAAHHHHHQRGHRHGSSSTTTTTAAPCDALLVGFAGHARLTLLSRNHPYNAANNATDATADDTLAEWQSSTLIDLTSVVSEHSVGAVTPGLEHDVMVAVETDVSLTARKTGSRNSKSRRHRHRTNDHHHTTTAVACILGGGVAVAVLGIQCVTKRIVTNGITTGIQSHWVAQNEPFVLPLHTLVLPHAASATASSDHPTTAAAALGGGATGTANAGTASTATTTKTMATGWGDIIHATFVPGYLEPVLVLLHTTPAGRIGSGRWGSGVPPPTYCTALSVSTFHSRMALLWSVALPTDAWHVNAVPPLISSYAATATTSTTTATAGSMTDTALVVVAVNSLTFVSAGGRVHQCLAVNGWARSGSSSALVPHTHTVLTRNPTLSLAIQLDGARLSWLSASCAALVLRRGPVYILQYGAPLGSTTTMTTTTTTVQPPPAMTWSVLPLGQTLGGVGEIADLVTLPLSNTVTQRRSSSSHPYWLAPNNEEDRDANDGTGAKHTSVGLLFAGSRLGDSILLGYALDTVELPTEEPLKGKQDQDDDDDTNHHAPSTKSHNEFSEDEILRLEDEALYESVDNAASHPDLIPVSDDDESNDRQQHKRLRIDAASPDVQPRTITVVRTLHPLDRLVHLGPLGPSCQGPLTRPPVYLTEAALDVPAGLTSFDSRKIFGALAHVFPAGYGSSGGLALMTVPGRDDRMIVAEEDCLHVACLFSLPSAGVVLLGMSPKANVGGGMRVFRLSDDGSDTESEAHLSEAYVEDWCSDTVGTGDSGFADSWEAFQSTLLSAGEGPNGMLLFVVRPRETLGTVLLIAGNLSDGKIELRRHCRIDWKGEKREDTNAATVIQVTPIEQNVPGAEGSSSVFCCVWSNGDATMITVTHTGEVLEELVQHQPVPIQDDDMDVDAIVDDQEKLKLFYSNDCVVAVDIFKTARSTFEPNERRTTLVVSDGVKQAAPVSDSVVSESGVVTLNADGAAMTISAPKGSKAYAFDDDDDDEELYVEIGESQRGDDDIPLKSSATRQGELDDIVSYLAVCRQSGHLEIYPLTSIHTPVWRSHGISFGRTHLRNEFRDMTHPRSHQISVKELRFFYHGPSATTTGDPRYRRLCISVVLTEGDVVVYEIERNGHSFRRKPLSIVARSSLDQARHYAKLARKGVLGRNLADSSLFAYNILHRFSDISGQDGLFAAGPRPHWFLSERGELSILAQRSRHAAPAGAKPRPVSGFCSGLKGRSSYITLHERVGRVGSQRLTVYRGLSSIFDSTGVMSGTGFCIEKIPLGVTVRQIVYLDDESLSTGDHPLYALLVSRELEVDESELNSDGLSDEERQRIEEEKNAARISRQVEADLGGFEVESEWVEAIERDVCFRVEVDLGGAPPVHKSVFSLWIVDAANDWLVVDSYDFEEYEHGIDLKALTLTEFVDEPGSSSGTANEASKKQHFLAVGTGFVNHDGEDVGTKGRLLLFEVQRSNDTVEKSPTVAELSLTYEKNIFHGPVTTVSCLSSEGVNRLVIGAGSDVNIEQWGNGKLTQVGFFRATMHILDITHVKNFLLLSDAYDSLYFLVWRESDKSLTLLAKDYDPMPVYAAGVMARGAAMTFVCHDDRQNLQFFQYAPGEAAARGGNKLVCRADFHLGSQTTAFRSHFCQPSLLVNSATPASTLCALKQQDALFGRQDDDQRLGVHFGTTDGSLGSIVPLSEPVYWRLMALQSVMSNALESDFSLNHRAWRLYRRTPRRGGCRSGDRKKGVIDGDLVLQYSDLAVTDQEDIASAIGSTVGLILDNLLEIQCGSMIM